MSTGGFAGQREGRPGAWVPDRLAAAAVALAVTALVGWYAVDLGRSPGVLHPLYALRAWWAPLGWLVVRPAPWPPPRPW